MSVSKKTKKNNNNKEEEEKRRGESLQFLRALCWEKGRGWEPWELRGLLIIGIKWW